jgi:predicted trehalose synthase
MSAPRGPRDAGAEPGGIQDWLAHQRWFAGKARRIKAVRTFDRIPLVPGTLYLIGVTFEDSDAAGWDIYLVALRSTEPAADAFDDPAFCRALLDLMRTRGEVSGLGTLVGRPSRAFPPDLPVDVPARRLAGEQSNTSVVFGDRLIMKHFRHLTEGINPDLEVTRFLTEHTSFGGTPRLAGALEYRHEDVGMTVAVAQELVPGARDGWQWLLERLAAGQDALAAVRRLGERTAELHAALATPTTDPAFDAEPITAADVAAWSDGVRRQIGAARAVAGRPLPEVGDVASALGSLVGRAKLRHHGDFHLGQTLAVADGRDFMIIDFEGEPLRPLSERRRKHTPLRDVAGMLRSLAYAAASSRMTAAARDRWLARARDAFVTAYRAAAGAPPFLPISDAAFARVVAALEMEKAAYEIVYEASHRPDWLPIPLAGFVSAAAALGSEAGAA